MIHLFSASHSIKSLSGENLIKCKGFVNTLFKCCAIAGNRSTTIESQCLQNGSWTPVELNCVPNEGNLLKGTFKKKKPLWDMDLSGCTLCLQFFLLSNTQSKMFKNCIFSECVKFRRSEKQTKFEKQSSPQIQVEDFFKFCVLLRTILFLF